MIGPHVSWEIGRTRGLSIWESVVYGELNQPGHSFETGSGSVGNSNLRSNLYVFDPTGRRRYRSSILAHALKMEFNRFSNGGLHFCRRAPGRHAAGQIRNVRRIVVAGGFNNDCVAHEIDLHFFKPDCFRILLSVPDAKSSLGLPATVTRPGLVGCLNCRWLPRVACKYQPSSCNKRRTSDTFITEAYHCGEIFRIVKSWQDVQLVVH
jgi:hypothetical protein